MERRKIPFGELLEALLQSLKPSDIIVFPDGHEIDCGTLNKTINVLYLKMHSEIRAVITEGETAKDLVAKTLAEHKIQSEPRPDSGVTWSCSCGARGHSADRRDHWVDLVFREMDDMPPWLLWPRTPESELERRKQILAAIDEALSERGE